MLLLDRDILFKFGSWNLFEVLDNIRGGMACRVLESCHGNKFTTKQRATYTAEGLTRAYEYARQFAVVDDPGAITAQLLNPQAGIDGGEAVLFGAALSSAIAVVWTGDKRALRALTALRLPNISRLNGRIICLEQLLLLGIAKGHYEQIRAGVCANLQADKTALAIFGSSKSLTTQESAQAGLSSYITSLRGETGDLLLVT